MSQNCTQNHAAIKPKFKMAAAAILDLFKVLCVFVDGRILIKYGTLVQNDTCSGELAISFAKQDGNKWPHPRSAPSPGAWTQTPISAWRASVHIVPGLRNGH